MTKQTQTVPNTPANPRPATPIAEKDLKLVQGAGGFARVRRLR